jgi:hypothetical protein
MCLAVWGGKMSAIRNTLLIKAPKTRPSVSSLPTSRLSNSRRPTSILRPRFYQQSPDLDVFISIRTQPTTSGLPPISRGTSRFTEAGTLTLPPHSPRATTAPAQDSVGPSAIDKNLGGTGCDSAFRAVLQRHSLCFFNFRVISGANSPSTLMRLPTQAWVTALWYPLTR